MSVVRVLCVCGKVFEIDDSDMGVFFADCPFCGASVRIPSREPGSA